MRHLITLTILGLMAGCATDPASDVETQALARHFDPIQAHQINDLQLSCGDLAEQIGTADEAIATLDKQIAHQEQNTTSFSLMGALAGVSGAFANNPLSAQMASAQQTVANTGAQLSTNQTYSTKDLRALYENRHEALMQLYYAKNCKSN